MGALVASLGACETSSSDGDDAGGSDKIVAEKGEVSVAIVAANGGTIEAPGKSATLSIGAGALASDVTITLAVTDPDDDTVASVYDFGPDGTAFTSPATLKIEVGDYSPPEGKKPVLAIEEDGKWVEIPGSTFAGGTVSGPVAHFSLFSIILVDGEIIVQSACEDTLAAFTACGGAAGAEIGTWKIASYCTGEQAFGDDGPFDDCPAATAAADVDVDGTFSFDGTTFKKSVFTSTITFTFDFPMSCAPQGVTCGQLTEGFFKDGGGTCSDGGQGCVCSGSSTDTDDAEEKPYSISGSTITIGDDPSEFCFKADGKLEVLVNKGEVNDKGQSKEGVIVLEKQ